ncbi:MAG: prepilin-type N-terminal cleavage/methylation domain-containing protein [Verrucomicrobia bacterium]|nr:prepilin-type N-terminal cleavage/methylation domain-containing protein [Verrucomicrobiota bacterium]
MRCPSRFTFHVSRSGFTLLEVMLAVAIVGTALFTIAMAIGRCTDAAKNASNYTVAHDLAELKLLECANPTNFTEGITTGDFGENFPAYQWQREIVMDASQLESLFKQTLTIKWKERNREYDVTLNTFLYNPSATSNSMGNALGSSSRGGAGAGGNR